MFQPIYNIIELDVSKFDNLSIFSISNFKVEQFANLAKNTNPHIIPTIEKQLAKSNQTAFGVTAWSNLSANPNAIHLIKQNLDKVNWISLCRNPNPKVVPILEENLDKVDWNTLCKNTCPEVISMIEKNLDKISTLGWDELCKNPSAISILEKNFNKINLSLCENPNAIHIIKRWCYQPSWYWSFGWVILSKNPNAIPILEKHLDKIDWIYLSMNPNAISILEKNIDKIDWIYLSLNPGAIPILEKHLDKVVWCALSTNPNAVSILEKNLDKVLPFSNICQNPNAIHLFTKLDLVAMKENCQEFYEELVSVVFHPSRLERMAKQYDLSFEKYLEFI